MKNWGEPDFQFFLKKLGDVESQGALYLIVNSDEEADCSILIYKGLDRILFFRKKRLNTHFKWSGFKEGQSPFKGNVESRAGRFQRALAGNALSLVA